jgi:preprotein translocase subunit YajC
MDAFAQVGAAGGPANPTIAVLLQFLQFVPIFLIIYFLLIRPQQQRQKQLAKMLVDLKKGDRVLTSGGIFGTVIGIDGVKVVIKIAEETKVEFSKSSITQVILAEQKQ